MKLVAVEIQREKDGEQEPEATDSEMPDDTDGLNPELEYRDWELREMRRIKRFVNVLCADPNVRWSFYWFIRDRDQHAKRREEAEETLRRRNLTEEERRAEDE